MKADQSALYLYETMKYIRADVFGSDKVKLKFSLCLSTTAWKSTNYRPWH